ncbi:MAG: hypothetical protein L6Q54_07805 [Leptospiraceae bacterium]|nr:hypothetical protein [Leptospiraceae bacterium]MCK6381138.1 hypothetical protein [Leptospiraceae bacterium]NUM40572.1 hypothetical protein [Leptospiraceae bacterium]
MKSIPEKILLFFFRNRSTAIFLIVVFIIIFPVTIQVFKNQRIITLTLSTLLLSAPKKEIPSQLIKKNETIIYKKLKLSFPFDVVVLTIHSQKPYLKIFSVKEESFFITIREFRGTPNFEEIDLKNLETSFLPNATYHPTVEYNFIKSYKIKKWSAEFIKNGNELNSFVYLVQKENEFYTIWVTYRKYISEIDSVFQKVNFFTNK